MKFILPVTLALSAFLLLGCSDDGDPSNPSVAEVRVAHLSPDAPAVDVSVDGSIVLRGVPFSAVSGYLPISPGSHRIQVTPAGAGAPVVIDAVVTLGTARSYTVAATGLLGGGDLSPLVLEDDRSAPGGSASVRFVHASPDAPAVDIVAVGVGPLFTTVAFREDGGYVTVPAGTYDLEVRVAGTTVVALSVPDVVLSGGSSTTIFAKGLLGNGTLAALAVSDSN